MPFLSDDVPVDETTIATENVTSDPLCNESAHAHGHSSNPYIPAWYLQVTFIVAFVVMITIAAGGNLIVIWIVLAHKRMRTVTNYFLVNLAVADALITVFNTIFNFIFLLYSDWPFGRLCCKFTQFISPCTMTASVLTFVAIAVDRYMVIIHPLKPRIVAGIVLAVIFVIWLTSVAVALPSLIYADTATLEYCEGLRVVCYLAWPDGNYGTVDFWYSMLLLAVTYVVPLAALAAAYTRVAVELWGSKMIGERTAGQDETLKSKRRIVKMMIVVVIIFAVCWLPQHVCFFVANQHPDILRNTWFQPLYLTIYWLAMSNAMYNPIVYCWMNARFRSGFKYALRWLPCVKWSTVDAQGFWGFMAARNASTLGALESRTSYAIVSALSGAGMSSMPPGERGRNQRRRSFDVADQTLGGRQTLLASRRRTSGVPELVELQYKYANGRFDSG